MSHVLLYQTEITFPLKDMATLFGDCVQKVIAINYLITRLTTFTYFFQILHFRLTTK